ncbi:MAG: sensor histidine kinase [Betaproteobacteria bacterium]
MATPCTDRTAPSEGRRSGLAGTLASSWRDWWTPPHQTVGPRWPQYVWTLLFNTCVAVVLSLIVWSFGQRAGLWQVFKWNWVISQSIGFTIHLLFDLGTRIVGRERIAGFDMRRRALFFAGIPLIGCLIGYWIGLSLLGVQVARIIQGAPRVAIAIILVSIIVSTFWYRYMANKARLAAAEAARERERTRSAELERLALDAQLRSLQAQIEPHFLFNTLANVVSLIDGAPDKARRMLERLIDLLRASLAASRSERTTLGQECALVGAYLDILGIRMGERLRYCVDLPAELTGAAVPPLSLQPLVENAIRHGLEPKLAGGTVWIRARVIDRTLQVDVEDDGLGFDGQEGVGVGLANLRERLRAVYGERARIAVSDRAPGTCVRVTIPFEAA